MSDRLTMKGAKNLHRKMAPMVETLGGPPFRTAFKRWVRSAQGQRALKDRGEPVGKLKGLVDA